MEFVKSLAGSEKLYAKAQFVPSPDKNLLEITLDGECTTFEIPEAATLKLRELASQGLKDCLVRPVSVALIDPTTGGEIVLGALKFQIPLAGHDGLPGLPGEEKYEKRISFVLGATTINVIHKLLFTDLMAAMFPTQEDTPDSQS